MSIRNKIKFIKMAMRVKGRNNNRRRVSVIVRNIDSTLIGNYRLFLSRAIEAAIVTITKSIKIRPLTLISTATLIKKE